MKTNLKLNSNLSLKSIEAKALKAAAIAAVSSTKERKAKERKKTPKKQIPTIEREIRSIFQGITANASEHNEVVVIEKSNAVTSRRALISVYNPADLARQKEDEAIYREEVARGVRKENRIKRFKANPVVMYAIYPDTYDSTKLGSVAIYGGDAPSRRTLILKQGTLFGHKVVSASLEMGTRLFVDVRLGA